MDVLYLLWITAIQLVERSDNMTYKRREEHRGDRGMVRG